MPALRRVKQRSVSDVGGWQLLHPTDERDEFPQVAVGTLALILAPRAMRSSACTRSPRCAAYIRAVIPCSSRLSMPILPEETSRNSMRTATAPSISSLRIFLHGDHCSAESLGPRDTPGNHWRDPMILGRVENRRSGCSLPVAVCSLAFAPPTQSVWVWLCFPVSRSSNRARRSFYSLMSPQMLAPASLNGVHQSWCFYLLHGFGKWSKHCGGARITIVGIPAPLNGFSTAFPSLDCLGGKSEGKEMVTCGAAASSSVHSPWGDVPAWFRTYSPSSHFR